MILAISFSFESGMAASHVHNNAIYGFIGPDGSFAIYDCCQDFIDQRMKRWIFFKASTSLVVEREMAILA